MRKVLNRLEAGGQGELLRNLQETKPRLRRGLLPPLGVLAFHGVDRVGVDFLHLDPNRLDIHGRKRPGESERAVDHPANVASDHVVLELAENLPGLR